MVMYFLNWGNLIALYRRLRWRTTLQICVANSSAVCTVLWSIRHAEISVDHWNKSINQYFTGNGWISIISPSRIDSNRDCDSESLPPPSERWANCVSPTRAGQTRPWQGPGIGPRPSVCNLQRTGRLPSPLCHHGSSCRLLLSANHFIFNSKFAGMDDMKASIRRGSPGPSWGTPGSVWAFWWPWMWRNRFKLPS